MLIIKSCSFEGVEEVEKTVSNYLGFDVSKLLSEIDRGKYTFYDVEYFYKDGLSDIPPTYFIKVWLGWNILQLVYNCLRQLKYNTLRLETPYYYSPLRKLPRDYTSFCKEHRKVISKSKEEEILNNFKNFIKKNLFILPRKFVFDLEAKSFVGKGVLRFFDALKYCPSYHYFHGTLSWNFQTSPFWWYPSTFNHLTGSLYDVSEVKLPEDVRNHLRAYGCYVFEPLEIILQKFIKIYPDLKEYFYPNPLLEKLAYLYFDSLVVPLKTEFENFIKANLKKIIFSFTDFPLYLKNQRVYVSKSPLYFERVFNQFIQAYPNEKYRIWQYRIGWGSMAYFNIYYRLVGNPMHFLILEKDVPIFIEARTISLSEIKYNFIIPDERLRYYGELKGFERTDFCKTLPNYQILMKEITNLTKKVEPLQNEFKYLKNKIEKEHKIKIDERIFLPIKPALGPNFFINLNSYLKNLKTTLENLILKLKNKTQFKDILNKIKYYENLKIEAQSLYNETNSLIKTFNLLAQKINELCQKEIIKPIEETALLPPEDPRFYEKYIEEIKKTKTELLNAIEELKNKIKYYENLKIEAQSLYNEVNSLIETFNLLAQKLNEIYQKEVIKPIEETISSPPENPLYCEKYIEEIKKIKTELLNGIEKIKKKINEIDITIKNLQTEVEPQKNELINLINELNKLYGKVVIDPSQILPPPPPAEQKLATIAYYEKLKKELPQIIELVKNKIEEAKKVTEITQVTKPIETKALISTTLPSKIKILDILEKLKTPEGLLLILLIATLLISNKNQKSY